VEVGQEPSTCPVQGVGNIVPRHRALPGNLANSGHFGRRRLGGRRPRTIPSARS
jgi:hypothetical protein